MTKFESEHLFTLKVHDSMDDCYVFFLIPPLKMSFLFSKVDV